MDSGRGGGGGGSTGRGRGGRSGGDNNSRTGTTTTTTTGGGSSRSRMAMGMVQQQRRRSRVRRPLHDDDDDDDDDDGTTTNAFAVEFGGGGGGLLLPEEYRAMRSPSRSQSQSRVQHALHGTETETATTTSSSFYGAAGDGDGRRRRRRLLRSSYQPTREDEQEHRRKMQVGVAVVVEEEEVPEDEVLIHNDKDRHRYDYYHDDDDDDGDGDGDDADDDAGLLGISGLRYGDEDGDGVGDDTGDSFDRRIGRCRRGGTVRRARATTTDDDIEDDGPTFQQQQADNNERVVKERLTIAASGSHQNAAALSVQPLDPPAPFPTTAVSHSLSLSATTTTKAMITTTFDPFDVNDDEPVDGEQEVPSPAAATATATTTVTTTKGSSDCDRVHFDANTSSSTSNNNNNINNMSSISMSSISTAFYNSTHLNYHLPPKGQRQQDGTKEEQEGEEEGEGFNEQPFHVVPKQQQLKQKKLPPPIGTFSSTKIFEGEVEDQYEHDHDVVEPARLVETSTEQEETTSTASRNIGSQDDNDCSWSTHEEEGRRRTQPSQRQQQRRQQRKYRIPAVAARHRRPHHHHHVSVQQDPPPPSEFFEATSPVVVSPVPSPSRRSSALNESSSTTSTKSPHNSQHGELRGGRERGRSFTESPISKSDEDDGREMRLDYSLGSAGVGIDSIDSIDISNERRRRQQQQRKCYGDGNGGEEDERDNNNNNLRVGNIDGCDDYDDQEFVGNNLTLCWRSDPSESLSDWALQIFNRTTKEFYTYHIHRVVLGVGPRACGYFQDVFQQQEQPSDYSGSLHNKVTRVPLIARACQAVPTLLDYCYRNPQFDVTRENAVALCYLADFFKNFPLWRLAADFIEIDLSTHRESIHHYYTETVYYDQSDFLFLVFATCAVELPGMARDYEEGEEEPGRRQIQPGTDGRQVDACNYARLLDELSPHHFSQILAEIESSSNTESNLASITKMVAWYCYLHRGDLSLEAFNHFISRITVLDTSSALHFLETSLGYDWTSQSGMNCDDSQESISSLVYFEKECISCLSDEWEALLAIDQGRITRLMEALAKRKEHSTILVQWFQKSILRAHKELSSSRMEKQKIEHEHTNLKVEFVSLKEEFDEVKAKLESLDRTYAVTKTELKDQIAGWVKKNENTERRYRTIERELDKQRLNWKQEREKWKNEKTELDRQVMIAREELGKVKQKYDGIQERTDDASNAMNDTFSVELSAYSLVSGFIPSLLTVADDSESADSGADEGNSERKTKEWIRCQLNKNTLPVAS